MIDPPRLLDEGANPEGQALLRAGVAEEPPPGGREALARALGVSLGSAAIAGAGAAKGAGLATKIALVAGGVVAGALVATYVVSRPAPPEPTSRQAPPAVVVPRQEPAASKPEEPAPAIAEPEPQLAKKKGGPTPAASASSGAASIAAEIALLDRARHALASGNAHGALSDLNEYDEVFEAGTLRQESRLLRIEALAKLGETALARKLGDRFLADHPKSPHEKRIRAVLGDAK